MLARVAIVFVKTYKACLSPYLSPACRFAPTCSEYAIEAFKTFGFFKGLKLTCKRIGKCHPWGSSGYDPVPQKSNCNLNSREI